MKEIIKLLSYHVVYDPSIADSIRFASENGFSGVQISVETPHLYSEMIDPEKRKTIRDLSEELGVRIVLHAPDMATPMLYPNTCIGDSVISFYSDLFRMAREMGAKLITMHPGYPVIFPTDTDPRKTLPEADFQQHMKFFKKNLLKLADMSRDLTLCLENQSLDSLTMNIINKSLNKKNFGLCWDIAKTYDKRNTPKEDVMEFFSRNIKSVKQVHLHDTRDGHNHRVVGTGIVDFKRFLGMLGESPVLDYCIEVRPREKALESLENLRKILK